MAPQKNTTFLISPSLLLLIGCFIAGPLSATANIKLPINSYIQNNPFVCRMNLLVSENNFNGQVFNVKDYGAKGDGKTSDTHAINKTIEAAANAGGGIVFFPAGTYLSGSIHLQNNISLYLGPGCVLEATTNASEYDPPEPHQSDQYQDFGHSHWENSLIWGKNLHHISITGPGKIWGKGLVRSNKKGDNLPNKTISLYQCSHVLIRDITVSHGGWFVLLATGVDNLTIDNVIVDTNRDGFDIDCCKNVRISNCTVNSPRDDGICLKSSYALGYARATENVTITNCQVSGYVEGTLLDGTYKHSADPDARPVGRIKFGTESNGGFKNITISNCVFDYCRGLALETVDGGLLEDVAIDNITMRDIVNAPIFLRLGSRMRGPQGTPVGELRRINISNIVVYNADPETGCIITGIPGHDIENVSVSNVKIVYQGGGTKEDAAVQPPEKEDSYPEPGMFGKLPSYGFYLRHVKGIDFTNIKISYEKKDFRPAFMLDDVKGADFRFINQQTAEGAHAFRLKNVKDFHLQSSAPLPDRQIEQTQETVF